MIFEKEYDLSLWYISKVRNQYRKRAVDFVKELPEEFLENIRTCYLKGINNNAGVDDRNDTFYNVRSKGDPNIFISPNDSSDIVHLKKSKERMRGSISIGQFLTIGYKEVAYSMKKMRFGYMIIQTYYLLGGMIEIKFGWPVHISNMPDELFREENT